MTFAQLTQKFRDGTVTDADLDGVSAEEWLQVRQEAGDGILRYALTDEGFAPAEAREASYARDKEEEGDEEQGRRTYGYVMVSDDLIPPLRDKVMANAWDTREFVYRGSNVLYDHNIQESRPPIGKVTAIQKGVELRKGGKTFKALTGDVEFADPGIYAFAGLVQDLVEAKLLSNGSVGFDVMKMRPPSEDEQETMGMKPFSAVIQKANLIEFSITPLGRDKNARLLSADGADLLEEKLAEFAQAGVHADSVLGEFRETLARDRGEATKLSVTVPEMPDPEPEAAPSWDATEISNAQNPITFADVKAREQLDGLRDDIAELRQEMADLKVQSQTDLFEALTELSAEPSTEQPVTGDGSSDIYTLARDLGFTADN
jgi:hypothetical protein